MGYRRSDPECVQGKSLPGSQQQQSEKSNFLKGAMDNIGVVLRNQQHVHTLGELDSRDIHQNFMQNIGRVVADNGGGKVHGITDGDVSKSCLTHFEYGGKC